MRDYPRSFHFRHLLVLAATALLVTGPSWAKEPDCAPGTLRNVRDSLEAKVLKEVKLQERKIISRNRFTTDRRLLKSFWYSSYQSLLGSDFVQEVSQLTGFDRWIDVGGGQAKWAVDYFQEGDVTFKASVTSVTAAKPDRSWLAERGFGKFKERVGDKFNELSGRYIEEYAPSEITPGTFLTDVYGALSYTPHMDVVLAKYGDLLVPDGNAHIYFTPGKIVDAAGKPIPFRAWIEAIQGFDVTRLRIQESDYLDTVTLGLKRNRDTVSIPRLELIGFDKGSPPQRMYRWVR